MLCGKRFRTLVVAAAQLPQDRQQGVAHQRVDLVDQQHQRLADRPCGPATAASRLSACHPVLRCSMYRAARGTLQRSRRPASGLPWSANWDKYGAHGFRHVLAHRLAPSSTLAYTHRKSPCAPPFSRSRSTSSADVLPVCRGACSTKYFLSRISPSTACRDRSAPAAGRGSGPRPLPDPRC